MQSYKYISKYDFFINKHNGEKAKVEKGAEFTIKDIVMERYCEEGNYIDIIEVSKSELEKYFTKV